MRTLLFLLSMALCFSGCAGDVNPKDNNQGNPGERTKPPGERPSIPGIGTNISGLTVKAVTINCPASPFIKNFPKQLAVVSVEVPNIDYSKIVHISKLTLLGKLVEPIGLSYPRSWKGKTISHLYPVSLYSVEGKTFLLCRVSKAAPVKLILLLR